MNRNLSNSVFATLIIVLIISGCSTKTHRTFSFAFYNLENLFDTIDNHQVADESYLPESQVAWNTVRYNTKLTNMSQVMSSVDPDGFPAIFGVCEVENQGVLRDLISQPVLRNANYRIIHKDSPDERGIDVALLYNPKFFLPLSVNFINPGIWEKTDSGDFPVRTRDILYAKGIFDNKDTLHIFINHWVSRWGGREETEPHRIKIAMTIKALADSIFKLNNNASIIIAGDLNDNPTDVSIKEYLNAQIPDVDISSEKLYNLSERAYIEDSIGSLYYKGWDMFDQIIVSGSMLLPSNSIRVTPTEQTVFKKEWMLYQPKEGPARPSRTSSSRSYYGGYSDHLPVTINIISD